VARGAVTFRKRQKKRKWWARRQRKTGLKIRILGAPSSHAQTGGGELRGWDENRIPHAEELGDGGGMTVAGWGQTAYGDWFMGRPDLMLGSENKELEGGN